MLIFGQRKMERGLMDKFLTLREEQKIQKTVTAKPNKSKRFQAYLDKRHAEMTPVLIPLNTSITSR